MKWFLACLTMLLPLVMPQAILAEEVAYYVVTSKEGALMTTTADEDGMKVAQLPAGTRISVVLQEDSWTRIDYQGRLGWVSSAAIAPFTEDVLPAYAAHYQTINEAEHLVYALLVDFTQDGVEDLYVVTDEDTSKGEYTERIYSNGQVIYQKNVTDALTILRSGTQYYIQHDATINRDTASTLKDLNNQAKTDYYEASRGNEQFKIQTNSYVNTVHILRAASGSVAEKTFISEEIASKDFYGAELVNQYNESVYAQKRTQSEQGETQELTEADFKAAMEPYKKATVVARVYEDKYRSAALVSNFAFKKQRVLDELMNLAEQSQHMKQGAVSVVSEADMLDLREKLAQSVMLELPFSLGERQPQQYVERMLEVIAMQEPSLVLDERGYRPFKQEVVDAKLLDFYGIKVDPAKLNEQAGTEGVTFSEAHYFAKLEENPLQLPIYRQLKEVSEIDGGFFAVRFADYELPADVVVDEATESKLIAGTYKGEGYVIFKKLTSNWVYIDTVEKLEGISMLRFEEYANSLAVKDYAPVEKGTDIEQQEIEASVQAQVVQQPEEQSFSIWVLLAIIICSFGLGYGIYAYKYKRV